LPPRPINCAAIDPRTSTERIPLRALLASVSRVTPGFAIDIDAHSTRLRAVVHKFRFARHSGVKLCRSSVRQGRLFGQLTRSPLPLAALRNTEDNASRQSQVILNIGGGSTTAGGAIYIKTSSCLPTIRTYSRYHVTIYGVIRCKPQTCDSKRLATRLSAFSVRVDRHEHCIDLCRVLPSERFARRSRELARGR
jgi:hypothetical protein